MPFRVLILLHEAMLDEVADRKELIQKLAQKGVQPVIDLGGSLL